MGGLHLWTPSDEERAGCIPIEFQTYRTWFQTWAFHFLCVPLAKFKQNASGSKHGRFMLYASPYQNPIKMVLVPNMAVSSLCVFPLNNGPNVAVSFLRVSRLDFNQNGPGSKHGRFISALFQPRVRTVSELPSAALR